MKKTTTTILLLATVCLMAACTKEGVYNPSEKISKIYAERSYTYQQYANGAWQTIDEYSSGKELLETWTWDGNKVSKITYDDWSINFTYDGKQLTKIYEDDSDKDYILFTYDGGKLAKFETFNDGELMTTGTVTHDGNKVSRIVLSYEDIEFGKSAKAARFEEKAIQLILPVANLNTLTLATKGAKAREAITYDFTWDGKNISQLTVSINQETETVSFTYDNKTNPYKGFVYAFEAEIPVVLWCSKNNVLSMTARYTWEGDTEEAILNYTYTYDGKWPVTRTETNSYESEDDRRVSSYTTYFEY